MPVIPARNAIPGDIWPGSLWPGNSGNLSLTRAGITISPGVPYTAGGGMGFTLGMSQLATMYYLVPVAATQAGVPYNPTGDPVAFAFLPQATQVPGSGDWVSGSWETVTGALLYPYNAKCLIGPAGTVTLGVGRYVAWLRITDNPEVPVLIVGQVDIS